MRGTKESERRVKEKLEVVSPDLRGVGDFSENSTRLKGVTELS